MSLILTAVYTLRTCSDIEILLSSIELHGSENTRHKFIGAIHELFRLSLITSQNDPITSLGNELGQVVYNPERFGRSGFEIDEDHRIFEQIDPDGYRERSKTLVEMAEGACFYFQDEISYEKKGDKKFLKPNVLGLLEELQKSLEKAADFTQVILEQIFTTFLDQNEIKLGNVAQPLRVALTGKTVSPGIFEVMEVLGKREVMKRVKKAILHIRIKNPADLSA